MKYFLLLALTLPGCASLVPILNDVTSIVQDAQSILDIIRATETSFFIALPDPVMQVKVEKALADASYALDIAIRATRGSAGLPQGQVDAAFDDFRKAYTELVVLLRDAGVDTKKISLHAPLALTHKVGK